MTGAVDELRPLTASQLLEIWRQGREAADDPLERALLCNARVLAACCYRQGERAFADEQAVLSALTGRQMESLLIRLTEGRPSAAPAAANPGFDEGRFDALQEGCGWTTSGNR